MIKKQLNRASGLEGGSNLHVKLVDTLEGKRCHSALYLSYSTY